MTSGTSAKPGRNEPCPCGSGLKHKACCGRMAGARPAHASAQDPELGRLIALLDGGMYAQLESGARALLAARPESGIAWQLLGVALGKQGGDTLHALTMAAHILPDDAVAQLNLGNALGRAGRLAQAQESYARALHLRPDFPEAHNNLGHLQLELGRFEEAVLSCRRALDARPDFAEAHRNLGNALVRLGRLDEALRSCDRALAIRPDFAEAHNSLGAALLQLARLDAAIASFRRAVSLSPDFAEAHVNLANALRSIGRLDEAAAGYRRALQIKPDFVAAHAELGTVLRLQRREAECEASCRAALAVDANCAAALMVLAELRADAGQFAQAEELFQRVISIDPDSCEAWAGLARLRRMSVCDSGWLASAKRLAGGGLPPQRELLLRYAIGKYYDDVRDFDRAFASYGLANKLAGRCGPAHDRQLLTRTIDLIIRSFDRRWADRERRNTNPSARPILIVGMLRSGTTLAEQILASHPAVFGAGELSFWGAHAESLIAAASAAAERGIEVSDAALQRLGDGYLELLQQLSPVAVRVVDKFPTNFLCLGLLHAALPGARIIHMQRHPIDTCLSIYFQHFEAANTYANDLEDLAHYYREYRRLMQHWRRVLPAHAMLEVPYEGLVGDLEAWSRRMLDHVGLDWDPRCLEFHRTARAVVTASKWQVRQPISPHSVERWRHYERFVGPLMALLPVSLP